MFAPANLMRHARCLVREPAYFSHRIRVMAEQLLHPDAPWLTRDAVRMLDQFLRPDMKGFEWGSGKSTIWLAQRLSSLVSVEHNPEWFEIVRQMARKNRLSNVDQRLASHSPYAHQISEFPDSYFDVILIDGELRDSCIRESARKINVGGYICLDNADSEFDVMPFNAFKQHATSNGVWRTDIYMRIR